jgi:hypothetical protein
LIISRVLFLWSLPIYFIFRKKLPKKITMSKSNKSDPHAALLESIDSLLEKHLKPIRRQLKIIEQHLEIQKGEIGSHFASEAKRINIDLNIPFVSTLSYKLNCFFYSNFLKNHINLGYRRD